MCESTIALVVLLVSMNSSVCPFLINFITVDLFNSSFEIGNDINKGNLDVTHGLHSLFMFFFQNKGEGLFLFNT